jgi:Flp pilus assembly secretin CpaC
MSRFDLRFQVLGVAAGLAFFSPPVIAAQNSITIQMDQVRVISFARAVKTVFVGNPTIADVTVIDDRHVFLLGKSFGSTNIIAIDDKGNQAADERVTVLIPDQGKITLQRGTNRLTLSCISDRCEATPTPGDQTEAFDAVLTQVDKHQAQSKTAAQ